MDLIVLYVSNSHNEQFMSTIFVLRLYECNSDIFFHAGTAQMQKYTTLL